MGGPTITTVRLRAWVKVKGVSRNNSPKRVILFYHRADRPPKIALYPESVGSVFLTKGKTQSISVTVHIQPTAPIVAEIVRSSA